MENNNNNSDNQVNINDKNKNINNDINDNKANIIDENKGNIQNINQNDIHKKSNNNIENSIQNEYNCINKLNLQIPQQLKDESKDIFAYLFRININDIWEYFITPSFIPTFLYGNSKIINSINFSKTLGKNDIFELLFPDKNIKIKIKIENMIEEENYKYISHKSIDVPSDMSPFIIEVSFFFCSVHQQTVMIIKKHYIDKTKSNFIFDNFYENQEYIFKNIEKYIEKNFKELEQSESISIDKSSDEVWNFLIKDNYSNLKILLGNHALVKPTNIPNEIEVVHFTRNNTVKIMINKNKEYNEWYLLLQIVSSSVPIPSQNISIKIININNKSCLLFFTHKMKQFISSDIINNYSLIKQKTLWLLKSIIENDLNNPE
jgi:hypothetical protein